MSELLREHLDMWNFLHVCFVRYSLTQSDDGTAALSKTGRQRSTVSHGRSFVLCKPGDDKGAWQ